MENRFNNRDFEHFVKQNADQYRMFPSEKVWDNIHNTLHTRRRWYGIGIALLLITVTAVTLVMVNPPEKNQSLAQQKSSVTADKKRTEKIKPAEILISAAKPAESISNTVITNTDKQRPTIFVEAFTEQPAADDNRYNPTTSAPILAYQELPAVADIVIAKQSENVAIATPVRTKGIESSNKPQAAKSIATEPAKALFTTITDNDPTAAATAANEERTGNKTDINLLTIESVVNSYKHTRQPKKVSVQVYVTPTISYRDLRENKAFITAAQSNSQSPLANPALPDVNNIVTHKPDLGFQIGATAGYPLTKNITLTGGLQLTVSKYDIKAYSHPSEVTTIALSNAAGGTNTVSTYTSYRNLGGYKANWLRNLYVSASAPIGLELKLASNKKGYVGVGGNVQPTFVIDNRSYLLSTDFKNYAEIPSLIRRWNINTGFEVFAATTTGKVKWRIGPQVRYQTMSSFIKKYPVKEHLFDFGLKLGVMLK